MRGWFLVCSEWWTWLLSHEIYWPFISLSFSLSFSLSLFLSFSLSSRTLVWFYVRIPCPQYRPKFKYNVVLVIKSSLQICHFPMPNHSLPSQIPGIFQAQQLLPSLSWPFECDTYVWGLFVLSRATDITVQLPSMDDSILIVLGRIVSFLLIRPFL